MKTSFTLIETILTLFLITIISSFFYFKTSNNKIDIAVDRLLLYLKQTRYQALIDNKEENNNPLWHKKRWTFKFFRCKKNVGGLYYSIYSDENMKGHPNLDESLIDPLTQKRVYSTNACKESSDTSKYVLLTKEYGINSIDISCNMTSSIGQISFGSDGKVYAKLSSNKYAKSEYEIKNKCKIVMKAQENEDRSIIIEGNTGYIYKEIN